MYRNQYDSDVATFSPQGRLHQVEYAMEAVKHGAACVGLKSKTHAVLLTSLRAHSDLSAYQVKIFKVAKHMGLAMSGFAADGRSITRQFRDECKTHEYVYDAPMEVADLLTNFADKAQVNTQRYGSRPFGVGLLVIGYDKAGPHLFETSPSANVFEFKAQSIGARSQSARTYLEKNFATFEGASLDDLVMHGLKALRDTMSSSTKMKSDGVAIAVVGKDTPFAILDEKKVAEYIGQIGEIAGGAPDMTMQE